MSLRVDWFGFAEGVAADLRGQQTLVGFSPKWQLCPTLPAQAQYFLVLDLADDEDPEPTMEAGRALALDLHIIDPDGVRLMGAQQTAIIGERQRSEVPGSALIVLGAMLQFTKYGRYRAEVTVTVPGTDAQASARRDLYILPE